jgi:hypothetical protein
MPRAGLRFRHPDGGAIDTTDAKPMAAKGMCVLREIGVRINATSGYWPTDYLNSIKEGRRNGNPSSYQLWTRHYGMTVQLLVPAGVHRAARPGGI